MDTIRYSGIQLEHDSIQWNTIGHSGRYDPRGLRGRIREVIGRPQRIREVRGRPQRIREVRGRPQRIRRQQEDPRG